MATQHLPLQERVPVNNTLNRTLDTIVFALLLSLLGYRLYSLRFHGSVWLVAFLAECWFSFIWLLYLNAKWSPVLYKTYPERLSKRFDDLPAIDMFVTTADPKLEPPIITVNTVLSLMAADYPSHKLACYVSDDGGSPITFYGISEAAKFAKLWIPFCKRYIVGVRAPFVYFSSQPDALSSSEEFMVEWKSMKSEYEDLSRRIENFVTKDFMNDEFFEFSNIEKGNHDTIIKVLSENKETKEGVPHLIYVAREKKPKHPHHYKAGAMNVLTRVSGVMTNAPFMLNVDCDMFANNSKVLLHGMCLLLGVDKEVYSGFVQTMQQFYDALKDDPFGNQLVVLQRKVIMGMGGIQGPLYAGTGCIHRRKVIYGSAPVNGEINANDETNDDLSYKELQKRYGNHNELIESACHITSKKGDRFIQFNDLSSRVEAAKKTCTCTYDLNTCWGKEVSEPGIIVPIAALILYIISNLTEYRQCGLSFRTWWNNQRMQRISCLTAWLFGLLSVILKILRLSETVFEVTRKDQNSSGNDEGNDPGRFTFDSSPMFIPGTAIVLLHIFALTMGLIRVVVGGGAEASLGEIFCSGWFLLTFWPFVRGLFGKGSYGIPWSIVVKAGVIVTVFLACADWSAQFRPM